MSIDFKCNDRRRFEAVRNAPELEVQRSEVREGDFEYRYGMWCRVNRTYTYQHQVRNFRAGYGIMSPADDADFQLTTKLWVGASDWKAAPADEMITIRRVAS